MVAGLRHLAELYRSLITCTVKNAVAVVTSGCAGGMDKSFGSKEKKNSWGKKCSLLRHAEVKGEKCQKLLRRRVELLMVRHIWGFGTNHVLTYHFSLSQ